MQEQVVIISFDWGVLQEVKKVEAKLITGAIVSTKVWQPQGEQALKSLMQQVTALRCDWIDMDYKLFTADMLTDLHKHKLKLGLWTVNTLDEIRQYAGEGVDALTSDRPDLFAQIV